eukprot:NODE_99_length_20465_cov_0.827654.p8 type:complete len:235 gc:universal NODE_99_length_20465_cov_0.827654:2850-2146(-)
MLIVTVMAMYTSGIIHGTPESPDTCPLVNPEVLQTIETITDVLKRDYAIAQLDSALNALQPLIQKIQAMQQLDVRDFQIELVKVIQITDLNDPQLKPLKDIILLLDQKGTIDHSNVNLKKRELFRFTKTKCSLLVIIGAIFAIYGVSGDEIRPVPAYIGAALLIDQVMNLVCLIVEISIHEQEGASNLASIGRRTAVVAGTTYDRVPDVSGRRTAVVPAAGSDTSDVGDVASIV